MNTIKRVIFIIGPTAIGKTDLSIKLAKAIKCEIISCDSRQFYKEFKIGTAPPSSYDLKIVKHHFIQNISIKEDYNAGKYEIDAISKINELHETNDSVIVVGGSGLYIDAICKGFDKIPEVTKENRERVKKLYEENGLVWLQEKIKKIDPKYKLLEENKNPKRLLRQLEVFEETGRSLSSFRTNTVKKRVFKIIKIGLQIDRESLYKRINLRVDLMMKLGFLNEVNSLLKYKNINSLQTVGYREIFMFLEKKITLQEAINDIKKNTRRFAKRQLTWFRKDKEIIWLKKNELSEILFLISK